MLIVPWRRPLALASPPRAFALTRATVPRSQADPVLFLIIKRVREPIYLSNYTRTSDRALHGPADAMQAVITVIACPPISYGAPLVVRPDADGL